MINIYMAAYKEFNNYSLLKKVCDYFLSRVNHDEITFFVTTGESGDNTCMRYVKNNGYNYIDWIPEKRGHNRADEKLAFIKKSNHVILFANNTSVGISIAMKFASKHVRGKIVIVDVDNSNFTVWKNGKKIGEKGIN